MTEKVNKILEKTKKYQLNKKIAIHIIAVCGLISALHIFYFSLKQIISSNIQNPLLWSAVVCVLIFSAIALAAIFLLTAIKLKEIIYKKYPKMEYLHN